MVRSDPGKQLGLPIGSHRLTPEYSDARVGIEVLVGPSEGRSECWLDLAEGFGTLIRNTFKKGIEKCID